MYKNLLLSVVVLHISLLIKQHQHTLNMPEKEHAGRGKKISLKKQASQIHRYMEEDNEEEVKHRRSKYIAIFNEFENLHKELYVLQSISEEDEDVYYEETLSEYTETLRKINRWMNSKHSTSDSSIQIAKFLALPKLELEKFFGDPQQLLCFISLFEETVENVANNGQEKLSRLLQLTTGVAYDAISSCALIGGESGFEEAKSILKKRFGNPHLISEGVISALRCKKPAHTPADL